jgi:hypothetical protein
MSKLADALALEEREFMKSINEANAEAQREIDVSERQMVAKGLAHSGPRFVRELEIRHNKPPG